MPMPWEQADGWIPKFDPPVRPLQEPVSYPPIGPDRGPSIATPPFLKPSLSAPAPLAGPTPIGQTAPPPKSALDRMAQLETQRPMRSDPNLKPSTTRRIIGALAGGALAAGEGYVNAAGRTKVDPNGGVKLQDDIANGAYNKATRDFEAKRGSLAQQAQIEQQKATTEQKAALNAAQIDERQKVAAEAVARTAAVNSKGVSPVKMKNTDTLIDPTTGKVLYQGNDQKQGHTAQTVDEYINQVHGNDTLDDTQKAKLITDRISEYNQTHGKDNPITKVVTDNKGNLTAVSVKPSQVAAVGGSMPMGAGGRAVVPRAPAKGAGGSGSAAAVEKGGGLSPAALDQAAKFYSDTGQIPPMGMGKEAGATRRAIINRSAELFPDVSLSSNKAEFGSDSAALKKLQTQRHMTESFSKTAAYNLDMADAQSKAVDRTGSPLVNKYLLWAKGQGAGDTETQKLHNVVITAANEYAKVISGSTSGTVTDAARKEAETMLTDAMGKGTFTAVVAQMKKEMANRNKGFEDQLSEMRSTRGGKRVPTADVAAPSAAAPVAYKEGQVLTNPKTGKSVKLVNNQWVNQ